MPVLYKLFSIWWRNNPARGAICLSVFLCHLGALFYLTNTPASPPKKKTVLAVRTITPKALEPQIKKTAPVPSVAPKPKTPPKTVPKTAKKQELPKKTQVAKKQPATPAAPSAELKPKEKKLNKKQVLDSLSKMEKSITQIETKRDKLTYKRELSVPSPVLYPEEESEYQIEYLGSLVDCLQRSLKLPDVGEVKVELLLRSDGKVERVRVLSSESAKNKKRLEEKLPSLSFPIPPEGSRLFIITFCNNA